MGLRIPFAMLALLMLGGCAVTNYATSTTPTKVSEQFVRQNATTWGGPKIFRIGNSEMGNVGLNGTTYTVDPGETVIKTWYYGNRDGLKGIFTQTDMVEIPVNLQANAHYEMRAEVGQTLVTFVFVDLGTAQEIARVTDVPIVRGPSRIVSGTAQSIPIFVPVRSH